MAAGIFSARLALVAVSTPPSPGPDKGTPLISQLTQEPLGATSTFKAGTPSRTCLRIYIRCPTADPRKVGKSERHGVRITGWAWRISAGFLRGERET